MKAILAVHINKVNRQVKSVFFTFLVILSGACSSISQKSRYKIPVNKVIPFPGYDGLNTEDQKLADSIIGVALDHEALYSLMGDLKPISSIGFSLSFPLAKDSLQFDGDHNVVDIENQSIQQDLKKLKQWNRVLKALSFDNYEFYLIPFKRPWKGERNLQIIICRKDLLHQLLEDKAAFFAQWGFVSGTHPAVILTTTEFEARNDRYRAYGYLFGYPDHAVNFFVDASKEYQETKKFVNRSFFNIPVYTKEKGYFTYALPEDFIPNHKDSLLLEKSTKILDSYKSIRLSFIDDQGNVQAVALYRDWWIRRNK